MQQGALRNNRRQAEPNTTLPVVPEARQKAQQPAARNQERYRTAGRRQTCRCEVSRPSRWSGLIGLLRNNRRNQLLHVTGAATTARPAPKKYRRQAEQNTTLPVVPEARQKAQQPAARSQERYRTAGRVLQARSEGSVLRYSTRAASAARRAPAKRDRSVNTKKWSQLSESTRRT